MSESGDRRRFGLALVEDAPVGVDARTGGKGTAEVASTLDVVLEVSGEGSEHRQRFRIAWSLVRAGAIIFAAAVRIWLRERRKRFP
jgi:hypothetical protein